MDELGFQRVEEALHRSIIIAVSLAAHRAPEAGGLHKLAVIRRGILGGFKRWSQHSEFGGCDEHCKAPIGTVRTSPIAIARRRPSVAGRNEQNNFWRAIAAGLSSEDAALEAG